MDLRVRAEVPIEVTQDDSCGHWAYRTLNGEDSACYGSFSEAVRAANEDFEYYARQWRS